MSDIISTKDTEISISSSRSNQEYWKLWQGNTIYSSIAFLLDMNKDTINNIAEKLGEELAKRNVRKKYDEQYFDPKYGKFKNFLTRNIYLSPDKQKILLEEREKVGFLTSLITEAGIKLVINGLQNWLISMDKYRTLEDVYSFLYSYTMFDIENTNQVQAKIELSKIRASFPLNKEQKIKLCKKVNDTSADIEKILGKASFMSDSNDNIRISLSYLLYSIHCQKYGEFSEESDALKNLKTYYNALGFHSNYANELLNENRNSYDKITSDQINYLKLSRAMVRNILIDVPKIDIAQLEKKAKVMALYDPYAIRRKKVQETAKNVGKTGITTLASLFSGNPFCVIQAASTALSQIALKPEAVDPLIERFKKNGIDYSSFNEILKNRECIVNDMKENSLQ